MASTVKNLSRHLAALSVFSLVSTLPALAAPDVVASVAPVHSIAAAIMKGVGTPHLLIPSSASPHSADLRPSGARALQDADLVFWVGPRIEAFLVKPLNTLAANAKAIPMIDAEGMTLLPVRSGSNWEKHTHAHDDDHEHEHEHEHEDHDDHEHEGHEHEGHEHEDHDKEGHEHAAEEHDHDAHDHDHDEASVMDNHIWLSPDNGLAMAAAITKALSEADPDNAQIYAANSKALTAEIKAASEEAKSLLADHKTAPFMVFHDAYQYFEAAFDVSAIGSITLTPGVNPGAARIKEIKEKLDHLGVACLMSEPQFSSRITTILVEGTKTRQGLLDPIGKELTEGPTLYPELIRYNARQLAGCLKGA
ncbi:zinc ABC transporter substrate-binding protein [Cohaesibacter sp. CAU 1516]|uniref:zinc ABC transporter substrate-binding protein n=1 Tax=Cohaesibacter sp. CAU 1516 TaxID=2576038 RepID=UPI0014853801|nr:zinc ABC transporter substrate-binding protein [Cohaesibacter sp. CAU 1516]